MWMKACWSCAESIKKNLEQVPESFLSVNTNAGTDFTFSDDTFPVHREGGACNGETPPEKAVKVDHAALAHSSCAPKSVKFAQDSRLWDQCLVLLESFRFPVSSFIWQYLMLCRNVPVPNRY